MIIRIWGRTVLNEKQNTHDDIAEEVKRAFSTRPCFGIDIRGSTNVTKARHGFEVREEPVRRLVSKTCALWSDDSYSDENIQEMEGSLCKICKNISSEEPPLDVKTEYEIQNLEAKASDRKSIHPKIRDHMCGVCGKGFFTKAHLKSHSTQKHPMHPAPFHASSNQHECSECGMDFETVLELSAHEESGQCEGEEDSFRQDLLTKVKCEIQDESDSAPRHWRDGDDFCLPHMKEELDNGDGYKQVDTKSYSRLDPLKVFDDKERLKHLKKALKKEKLGMPCEVCAEWVSDKASLGVHMSASHPGEKPFECTFCDRAYKSAAQMNIHRDAEFD